ncbi:MAG TPA: lytic transglycosylase domain-containing protein [Candidatus Paceibacterota bacterium]|nr:lytic transglycosylase domain-containing protein [Candidatus Paceibacterota bacterium]
MIRSAPRLFAHAVIVAALFAVPLFSFAVDFPWWPIVPCGLNRPSQEQIAAGEKLLDDSYYEPCNQCELIQLGKNIIDIITYVIVPVVGTLLFIYAGFRILISQGSPRGYQEGMSIMRTTAVGIAIMLGSWLITNFVLKSLAGTDDNSPNWYTITCTAGPLGSISGGGATPGGTTTPSAQPTQPGAQPGQGATCPQSNLNLCQGQTASSNCGASTPACQQYGALIKPEYVGGPVTAELLKSIIANESTCNPTRASSAGAYGLTQLKPGTANQYKQYCGITANITASWLTNPANAQAEICITAQYLKQLAAASSCGLDPRNMAAGYNGGPGACKASVDCTGQASCSGSATKAWECLYDNTAHTTCNTGYNETRNYATRVLYCVEHPGF